MRKRPNQSKWNQLADENGELNRRYPLTAIAVPRLIELDLEESVLRWSLDKGAESVEPSFELLVEFLDLSNGSPHAILSFAKRWGVLGLCKHRLPASHSILAQELTGGWCDPLRDQTSLNRSGAWELVTDWRRFALEADAILTVAINARVGEPVTRQDAERAAYGLHNSRGLRDEKLSAHPGWVVDGVNRWLRWGDVRPELVGSSRSDADEGAYEIVYGGAADAVSVNGLEPACFRLFGALAIQLMHAVSGDTLPAHCASCRRVFALQRSNQKYCSRCGTSARNRRAAKRSYDEKRHRKSAQS